MEGKVRQRNFDKDAFTEHEGNAEEENNGYVVFKCKIYGSAVREDAGRRETLLRPPPSFLQQASGHINLDDVNVDYCNILEAGRHRGR